MRSCPGLSWAVLVCPGWAVQGMSCALPLSCCDRAPESVRSRPDQPREASGARLEPVCSAADSCPERSLAAAESTSAAQNCPEGPQEPPRLPGAAAERPELLNQPASSWKLPRRPPERCPEGLGSPGTRPEAALSQPARLLRTRSLPRIRPGSYRELLNCPDVLRSCTDLPLSCSEKPPESARSRLDQPREASGARPEPAGTPVPRDSCPQRSLPAAEST